MRAGGLTGTAAADGEFAVRAPVAGAAGPGWSRVAVVAATPFVLVLPAGLTRRVDGRGALRPVRVRRALTSPDPFACVLRVSSATPRLFLTAAVMCS
ncbi:hypothetical protein [Pseudonocardia sp. DSM 110487]|uniref:hypothetical protein n=1 Tax=Pseudonocardia sp. DSM 110487 TaxID=2865833 RepID=UPI002103AA5E|nr:hypothetical protein [Pseudonocardia sp. DSM 110487]